MPFYQSISASRAYSLSRPCPWQIERYRHGGTLITNQIPVEWWHDLIGDTTLADAILRAIAFDRMLLAETTRYPNGRMVAC